MSRNERGSGDSYTNRARESRAPEIERDKGAPFTINLFGAIEIFRDGQALTSFRSQKTLVLFAYLICEDRPVTREYLAGLGWPEANQQQALGLLRRSLHNLSSKLPGSLVIDRRTAWFCAESTVHVDVCTFSAMAAQDDPTAWAQAAALYRAPFLEGVYLDDAPELESWLAREQEAWQQRMVELLDRLIAHAMAEGAYDRALHYARRLTALEPSREEAHRRIMLLLARTGEISAALAHYRACQRILRTELDVEPAQSTQQLYDRLRSIHQQQGYRVPSSATPIVGREEETSQLVRWLTADHCRLITLVGVGGIGKTRLALELARTVANDRVRMFLHGALFVPLAGVDSAAQMAVSTAQLLGLSLQAGEPAETQIVRFLQDKELLLVLDNFEQFVDEHGLQFLVKLLDAAPAVKVLVTSRIRLGLHCEQLYWLQGLAAPRPESPLDAAQEYGAIRLWTEAARRRQPDYAITAQELPMLLDIATQVQGMPLALELAAAWRGVLSLEAIAEQLAQNLDFLSSNAPDLPSRQRSMRAIFQTSWQLLTASEQAIFPRLALFRGGFTLELAGAVAGADAAILQTLQDKSLVSRSGEERYILHELIRQFAAEELAATGELHATQKRHAAALLAFIERIEAPSRYFGDRPGLALLHNEYENIQAALHWCFGQSQGELGLALVAALRDYWMHANNWREGRQWQEMALKTPPTDETLTARATVLNELGVLLGLMGEINLARSAHQESLRIFELLGDQRQQAWALYQLACPEYQDGNDSACNELLYTALETFRQAGEERGVADALYRLTLQMVDGTEELNQAEEFGAASLTIARRLDARSTMAGVLILLGEVATRQGDLARAAAHLTESLSLSTAGGGVRSWALGKLGKVFLKQEKLSEAKKTFQKVLRMRQELGSIIGVAWMLEALGEVAVASHDEFQAVQLFGVAATLRARQAMPLLSVDKQRFEQLLVKSRAALGSDRFSTAWQLGEQLAQQETDFAALFGRSTEEDLV